MTSLGVAATYLIKDGIGINLEAELEAAKSNYAKTMEKFLHTKAARTIAEMHVRAMTDTEFEMYANDVAGIEIKLEEATGKSHVDDEFWQAYWDFDWNEEIRLAEAKWFTWQAMMKGWSDYQFTDEDLVDISMELWPDNEYTPDLLALIDRANRDSGTDRGRLLKLSTKRRNIPERYQRIPRWRQNES